MLKNAKKEPKSQSKQKTKEVDKKTPTNHPATTSNIAPSLKKDSQYLQNLINLFKTDATTYQEYKYMCYFDKIYALNDCVVIRNFDNNNIDDVGQITKIMRLSSEEQFLILVEVQWYYNKSDLHKNYKDYLKFIGENEVFLPANFNRDVIEIQNIHSFCEVIPQDKYEKLTTIPPNVFFYRAKYDNFSKKMIPEPEKWPKYCLCESPYCPDLPYIQCDACDKWFHCRCVGLDEKKVPEIENFVCAKCQMIKRNT